MTKDFPEICHPTDLITKKVGSSHACLFEGVPVCNPDMFPCEGCCMEIKEWGYC